VAAAEMRSPTPTRHEYRRYAGNLAAARVAARAVGTPATTTATTRLRTYTLGF